MKCAVEMVSGGTIYITKLYDDQFRYVSKTAVITPQISGCSVWNTGGRDL
jgi:hypothetical protein